MSRCLKCHQRATICPLCNGCKDHCEHDIWARKGPSHGKDSIARCPLCKSKTSQKFGIRYCHKTLACGWIEKLSATLNMEMRKVYNKKGAPIAKENS